MSFGSPSISSSHPDYAQLSAIRDEILAYCKGKERLLSHFPAILQDAIDFVLDPVRTARHSVRDLDNVEKTFVGLKVEHFVRDFLDVPKGLRDLRIGKYDVDVKNTVSNTWMIPPETYRNQEACLLIAIADSERRCWLGLIVARDKYLDSKDGNRDSKRQITAYGRSNILWLVEACALPESRWAGIDMARFRALRRIKGGKRRATSFFRENLDKVIHRSIVQALLFDQRDYMKRLRGNGGARDALRLEGIFLLSGAFDGIKIAKAGLKPIGRDEFVAVRIE